MRLRRPFSSPNGSAKKDEDTARQIAAFDKRDEANEGEQEHQNISLIQSGRAASRAHARTRFAGWALVWTVSV